MCDIKMACRGPVACGKSWFFAVFSDPAMKKTGQSNEHSDYYHARMTALIAA
jgi:hypothetical protein